MSTRFVFSFSLLTALFCITGHAHAVTIWSDNMDSNAGLWTSDGIWEWSAAGPFSNGPASCDGGSGNCWGTDFQGNYSNYADVSMISPVFNLTDYSSLVLTFSHWMNTEQAQGTLWDGGNIKVSTDGGTTWIDLDGGASFTDNCPPPTSLINPTYIKALAASGSSLNGQCGYAINTSSAWTAVTINLDTATFNNASQFRFKFHFGSDVSGPDPGWYIDTVALSGTYDGGDNAPPFNIQDVDGLNNNSVAENASRPISIKVEDFIQTAASITLYYWREGLDDSDFDGVWDTGEGQSTSLTGTAGTSTTYTGTISDVGNGINNVRMYVGGGDAAGNAIPASLGGSASSPFIVYVTAETIWSANMDGGTCNTSSPGGAFTGSLATDEWECSAPSSVGPPTCYNGAGCWGTNINGNYLNGTNISIETPSISLVGRSGAKLVYYQYVDIDMIPVTNSVWVWQRAFSGGNVKVSTDGGTTWTGYLNPESPGYNIRADSSAADIVGCSTANSNALGGEKVFGKDDKAWKKVVLDLSSYANMSIKIKFHFSSMASGGCITASPGWYMDDLRVVETAAKDTQAPSTSASLSGTAGANGWYTGPVTLSLSSADQGSSGLSGAYYQLDPTVTSDAYEWLDATGGTQILTNHPYHASSMTSNICGTNTTPPFNFTFYGTPYTSTTRTCVGVSGTYEFTNESATLFDSHFPTTAGGVISGLANRFSTEDSKVVGSVWFNTLGSSPSRKLVVTWNNVYNDLTGATSTFQAVLHETHEIKFNYQTVGTANDPTVGANQGDGVNFTEYTKLDKTGAPASGTSRVVFTNKYSIPLTITADKLHKVMFYALDKAHNVETLQSVDVKIDGTAPTCTSNVPAGTPNYGPSFANNPGGIYDVDFSDATSGLDTVEYCITNNFGGADCDPAAGGTQTSVAAATGLGGAASYTSNWGISDAQWAVLADTTNHTIYYRAKDVAGNISSCGSNSFTVGKNTGTADAPSTSISFGGIAGNNGWYKSGGLVTLTATPYGGAAITERYYHLSTDTYSNPWLTPSYSATDDISGTGTTWISGATGNDTISGAFNLGFYFPFEGSSYSQVKLTDNGYVTFNMSDTSDATASSCGSFTQSLRVAPLWGDWRPVAASSVKYQTKGAGTVADPKRFIAQWSSMDSPSGGTQVFTFRVILYQSGLIEAHYQAVVATKFPTTFLRGIKASGAACDSTTEATASSAVGWKIHTVYSAPFSLTTQGTNTVFHHAADDSGKVGQIRSDVIKIDSIAPTVTINTSAYGPYISDPGAVIDVDFSNGGSGTLLDYAEYCIGSNFGADCDPVTGGNQGFLSVFGTDTANYTTNWSAAWTSVAEGTNTIYIRTIDAAGNQNSTTNSITFSKNTTKPVVDVNASVYGPYTADPASVIDVDFHRTGAATLSLAQYCINSAFGTDCDPGTGGNQGPITVPGFSAGGTDFTSNWGVTWSTLAYGTSTIYLRSQDSDGDWDPDYNASAPLSVTFTKNAADSEPNNSCANADAKPVIDIPPTVFVQDGYVSGADTSDFFKINELSVGRLTMDLDIVNNASDNFDLYFWNASCVLDSAPNSSTSTTLDEQIVKNDLAVANYYVEVRWVAGAGNYALQFTWQDTVAPTWPSGTGIQTLTPGNGVITIGWNAASDPATPITYNVWRCTGAACNPFAGSQITNTSNLTYNNTGLTNNTTYCYGVRAKDNYGNIDANTVSLCGTPTDPNTPDLILVTASEGGAAEAGIGAGDTLTLEFDKATNAYAVTTANINTALAVSGKDWPAVTSASWTTLSDGACTDGGANCFRLKITFTNGTCSVCPAVGDSISIGSSTIMATGSTSTALGSPPNIAGSFSGVVKSLSAVKGALQAFGANVWTQCPQAQSDYDSDLAGTGGDTFLGTFIGSREGGADSGDVVYAVNSAGTALRASYSLPDGTASCNSGNCGDIVGTPWHYTDETAALCSAAETEAIWFGTTKGRLFRLNFTGGALGLAYAYNGGDACKGTSITFDKITTGVQGDNEMLYFGAQVGTTDYFCSVCWNLQTANTYCDSDVGQPCVGKTAPVIYNCLNVDSTPPTEGSTVVQYNASATDLKAYVAGAGTWGVTEWKAETTGLVNPQPAKDIGSGQATYGLPYFYIPDGKFYALTASGSAGALRVFDKTTFTTDYLNYTTGVGPARGLEPWLAYGGIFFGDDSGNLHCVVESSGLACTGFPVQPDGTNDIRSQPIVQNGVLYFSNAVGKIYAYDITTNCCTLKSPVQINSGTFPTDFKGYPFDLGVNLAGSLVPNEAWTFLMVGGSGGNIWYLPLWTTDPTP